MRAIAILVLMLGLQGCLTQQAQSQRYPISEPIDPVTEETPHVIIETE